MTLLHLLCAVIAAGPAPKVKGKKPPPLPPAQVSPLTAIKVGDYVEYEFSFLGERTGATRLRAQAAERSGTRLAIDESRGDGPRGSACLHSKDVRLALGSGLVDIVRARGKRERNSVTSKGGRLVRVVTRWEESLRKDRVDDTFGGTRWREITTDEWTSNLPRWLLELAGAGYLPQVPKGAKPGPPFTAGPVPVETLVYEEGGARMTVVAKPELVPQLSLDLRYGVLRREVIAGPSEHDFEVIEWK